MVGKRTYSTRDKQRAAYQHDASLDSNKRRKHGDPDDENSLTPSFVKKSTQRFSGPVSIPEDDMAVEMASYSGGDVFDKALSGRLSTLKPNHVNIHGSRDDFNATMIERKNSRESGNTRPQASHLPTPPAESEKQSSHSTISRPTSSSSSALKPASTVATTTGSTGTSRMFEKIVETETPRQPYIPKEYESRPTLAPRKKVTGEHLSKTSKEAKLWSTNQAKSLFLRLPVEVRSRIYEYTLGGNTINIGYKTYQIDKRHNEPGKDVTLMFKYQCTVFNEKTNPYIVSPQPWVKISTSFTLLNNICRQLHHETTTLPYKLNRIAFDSHLTIWNFMIMETRLSRQQRHAITEFMLPDTLPEVNMLTLLPNVVKVYLGRGYQTEGVKQVANGWYHVVRQEGREMKLVHSRDINTHSRYKSKW